MNSSHNDERILESEQRIKTTIQNRLTAMKIEAYGLEAMRRMKLEGINWERTMLESVTTMKGCATNRILRMDTKRKLEEIVAHLRKKGLKNSVV